MIMISRETQLFLKGIKPALLVYGEQVNNEAEKAKLYNMFKEYNILEWTTDKGLKEMFISHNKISMADIDNNEKKGLQLGYYPEAVRQFSSGNTRKKITIGKYTIEYGTAMDYHGFSYNVTGCFKKALKWHNEQYGKKILESDKEISVGKSIKVVISRNHKIIKRLGFSSQWRITGL
jgi:hypothetical protein